MIAARNGTIDLAFDIAGSGPDLLLIAGTASTRPIWSLVRPALAQTFRTVAFDNRDSGESTIATTPYSMTDLADDCIAVLDAADVPRAHILGHSMGGAIAQELALRHPERCVSLTLVCSWARGDGYTKSVVALLAALSESACDDRTLLASILYAGSTIEGLRATDLFARADVAMSLGPLAPREALLRQWSLDLEFDSLDRLHALELPVHVIWCDEDRLLPPPASQQLAEAIRGSKLTRIERSGHSPMIDAPEAFVDAVRVMASIPVRVGPVGRQ
jgi:pimeloyl-ACP methyl ester carboxylesterase